MNDKKETRVTEAILRDAIIDLGLIPEDFEINIRWFACNRVTSQGNEYFNHMSRMVLEYLRSEGHPVYYSRQDTECGKEVYDIYYYRPISYEGE